jgi:hypothetical protein
LSLSVYRTVVWVVTFTHGSLLPRLLGLLLTV